MSVLDHAQMQSERHLAQVLAIARETVRGPAPTGRCLYCEERQQDGARRWCDDWCRDNWQKERDALLRNVPVGKGDPQP